MAERIRQHDWAATPLGAVGAWPESLRTAVRLVLASRFPTILFWGPDLTVAAYNDAYRPLLGDKPEALGRGFLDVWSEASESIAPEIEGVLRGEPVIRSDALFELRRRGEPEPAWFDYQFSPVFDDDGVVAGVLNIAVETTGRVLGERARAEAAESLHESERRLRSVLDGMDEAFGLMDHDFRIVTQKEAALRLDGRLREEILGRTHWDAFPGSENTQLGRCLTRAMRKRVPTSLEHRYRWPDGRESWLEMRAFPVPEGLAVFWRDIAERKEAEIALERSEARLRKVLEIETVGVVFFDLVGGVLDANDAFLSMIGYSRAELERGEVRYENLTPPDWRWRDEKTIAELKEKGEAGPFEKEYTHKDGSRIWILCADKMLEEGTAVEIVIHVTARKRAEGHKNMLMAELDHRVKNIIALVQSIARQTLGRGQDAGPDAGDRLIGRIGALAQSHRLLASSQWEGARLRDLVDSAVAPYRNQRADRVVAEGPDLKVLPKAAQTLTLALHELVTNAAKYGSLSREEGRVETEWHLSGNGDDRRLIFCWQELGGPLIEAPPDRKGFGSSLIERTLAFELEGDVTLGFARDGLRVEIRLPLEKLLVEGADCRPTPRPRSIPQRDEPTTLEGKHLLVLEDEYLVGEEAAEGLRSAGFFVTGPVGTLPKALQAAAAEDIDAAVLDVNLDGDFVWPAARVLRGREIPFVFTTGYSKSVEPPPDLTEVPWIEKPLDLDRLVATVAGLL